MGAALLPNQIAGHQTGYVACTDVKDSGADGLVIGARACECAGRDRPRPHRKNQSRHQTDQQNRDTGGGVRAYSQSGMSSPPDSNFSKPTEAVAPRRTMLAAERTQLAWWRTGFALLAVGLAIGKIVPQLARDEVVWPYTVLGAAFGLFAIVMTLQGSHRRSQVEIAVKTGQPVKSSPLVQRSLTACAVVLALATTLMIIFN